MKATRHATTNYRALRPFLDVLRDCADEDGHSYRRFTSDGFEPLSIGTMGTDRHGNRTYYMAHYFEQNGDLMSDPDMTFAVDETAGTVEPLSYQLDAMGVYQRVYKTADDGTLLYSPRLRSQLDDFLWQWLRNIRDQGFRPDVCEEV